MATFACETCGLELSSKHALESHVNRKYKCVPPGQVQYECRTCDKQFPRKNLLDQHLRTDKHRQVVAAAEAAEGTGSTSIVASETCQSSTLNINSHTTTTNSTNVQLRPRSFGRANVDHTLRESVKARRGRAAVFDAQQYHVGARVEEGRKYLLRTDVMGEFGV